MNQVAFNSAKFSCSCQLDTIASENFRKFHIKIRQMFQKLGFAIAKYPYFFIIIPFCTALVCITGLSKVNYINDFDYLYTPTNAPSWNERNITETLFPLNYSHGFDPSRLIKFSGSARLLISATDNQTMFRSHIWNSVTEVDRSIKNLSIVWEDFVFTYGDLCAKFNGKCLENDILKLDDIMIDIEDGNEAVNYPIMLFPLVLPFSYGEITANETEGIIISARSLSLAYWFKVGNTDEKERSELFEKAVVKILQDVDFKNISIVYIASISLNDEFERTADSLIPRIFPTVIIIFIITTICLFEVDWVRNKILLGFMGIITTGLATGCSFGLLMFFRVPFTLVNLVVPFLLLEIVSREIANRLISDFRNNTLESVIAESLGNLGFSTSPGLLFWNLSRDLKAHPKILQEEEISDREASLFPEEEEEGDIAIIFSEIIDISSSDEDDVPPPVHSHHQS